MTKPGQSYLEKLLSDDKAMRVAIERAKGFRLQNYVNEVRSNVRRQQEWLHTVGQYSAELPEQQQRYVANALTRLAKTAIAT